MPPRPRPHPVDALSVVLDDEVGYIQPPFPQISPEEQARIEREQAEAERLRLEKALKFSETMENWWIEKEMVKDPQNRDRSYWKNRFDYESSWDW